MNLQVRLHDLLTTEDLAARSDFSVGHALIGPSTRTINICGERFDVEPRVMQVLVVLADANGAVVTRETLFRRCWGSPAVTNDSLNRAIFGLRRLAASCAGAFDVETIPRVGYRLKIGPAAVEPPRTGRLSRRQLIGAATGAVMLLPAGVGGTRRLFQKASPDPRVTQLIARSDQIVRNGIPGPEAVRLLEQAVVLQPDSSDAWGRLALARFAAVEQAPPARATAAVAATEEAARRALALDSRCADALCALALLPPYYGDWAAGERRMRSVLAVDPDHLPTRDALDFMLAAAGRAREGSLDRTRFAGLDPLNVVYQFKLVYALWILGDVAAADRAADRALQLWPKHPAVWFARVWSLALTGRPERALLHINDTAALPVVPPNTLAAVRDGVSAMASRRPKDISNAADAAVGMIDQGPSEAVSSVMLLLGLGQIDRAFDVTNAYLLEQGPLIASVRWRPGQLSVTDQHRRKTNMLFLPAARPMQEDSRFMPLMKSIGLTGYWKAVNVQPDFLLQREA